MYEQKYYRLSLKAVTACQDPEYKNWGISLFKTVFNTSTDTAEQLLSGSWFVADIEERELLDRTLRFAVEHGLEWSVAVPESNYYDAICNQDTWVTPPPNWFKVGVIVRYKRCPTIIDYITSIGDDFVELGRGNKYTKKKFLEEREPIQIPGATPAIYKP